MNTRSIWVELTEERPHFPSLQNNIEVDTAVIGGGITGITCAQKLSALGIKTAVIEAKSIGGGTTAYSTGNLYVATQPYFKSIKDKFDIETVSVVANSRKEAIDHIERLISQYKIECQFQRRPWYMYSSSKDNSSIVEDEVEVLKQCGIDISFTESIPLPVKNVRSAIMENQARFNPYKYTIELAKAIAKEGCSIHENTPVTEIKDDDDECCTLKAGNHTITCKHLIIATHIPKGINNIQFAAMPYRSYVVAAKIKEPVPNGNFWDVETPHHVTSSHPSRPDSLVTDLLMAAGSHHKTGQPDEETTDHYKELEDYLHQNYKVESIAYRWSAQHYKSADTVPYIGKSPGSSKNCYIGTGYFADGLTFGTVAGMLLPDLIAGKKNPWAEVYDSTRFTPIKSAAEVLKENFNELMVYLSDMPWSADSTHFSDVKNGEGKIIKKEGEKYAAYRDDSGKLHVVSAVCTHLACIVEWNNAEKSWDCPCHGSRFTYDGEIIEGPALYNLKKANLDKE